MLMKPESLEDLAGEVVEVALAEILAELPILLLKLINKEMPEVLEEVHPLIDNLEVVVELERQEQMLFQEHPEQVV